MIRYFQLSDIKKVSGQCPLYEHCQTGKALLPESCAKYRCNTFYEVDTLVYFRDLIKRLEQHAVVSNDGDDKKDSKVVRIVEQHFNRSTNGNGHTGGRKGMPSKLKCIS